MDGFNPSPSIKIMTIVLHRPHRCLFQYITCPLSFIFSPRSWRVRQIMYGCKMLEVLMANAFHRLVMRCNNEVTQWELSWIVGVGMHTVSHTNSSSITHTRAECHSDTHFTITPHPKTFCLFFYTTVICMHSDWNSCRIQYEGCFAAKRVFKQTLLTNNIHEL